MPGSACGEGGGCQPRAIPFCRGAKVEGQHVRNARCRRNGLLDTAVGLGVRLSGEVYAIYAAVSRTCCEIVAVRGPIKPELVGIARNIFQPGMQAVLVRLGHSINRKRGQRLMRFMGLEAIYPKPNLSRTHPDHEIFPYLFRDLDINRCNLVWGTDIIYIRLHRGWLYLVPIMDWFSRYALSLELSTSLEMDFCLMALETALTKALPEIFNLDQGFHFTSLGFIDRLKQHPIRRSMDGLGRAMDNIFTERLWRSLNIRRSTSETMPRCLRPDMAFGLSSASIMKNAHTNPWGIERRLNFGTSGALSSPFLCVDKGGGSPYSMIIHVKLGFFQHKYGGEDGYQGSKTYHGLLRDQDLRR